MKRVMVYSHDTYGLGNIRRMLAICEHLVETMDDVSVLLVSGSPMVQSFRIGQRIDYVKLPAIRRVARESYSARSLSLEIDQLITLRANMICSAVKDFEPDLILVDKKPLGVHDELAPALEYVRKNLPLCRRALVLRDILDAPERTRAQWRDDRCDELIRRFYNVVFVLGSEEVFDVCREYDFAADVRQKVRYCGYVARKPGRRPAAAVRSSLGINGGRMVLVTPGGGEDGYALVDAYVNALAQLPSDGSIASVIVTGSDMPAAQQAEIAARCAGLPHVRVLEFVDDMMSYMAASDLVVSMCGYNTFCEIASARRRAVIVPRAKPVLEQSIRAERFAARGLLTTVDPDSLSPATLAAAVRKELRRGGGPQPEFDTALDMNALPNLANVASMLLSETTRGGRLGRVLPFVTHVMRPIPVPSLAHAGGIQ